MREAAFIDLILQAYRAEKTEGKAYRAFEILNLGKYEQQHYIGIEPLINANAREFKE